MASSLSALNLPLRIHRRGDFFSDDGFLDFRGHFETATNDLLREFDLLRHEDSFKSYRHLRDRHLSATDKTAKIAEESDKYKIVMDVEGFSDSNLQVRISGPNEIVVEGRQETGDGGVYSQRSFSRRFSLPGLALVQDSTSVLSSDNVLTINIPKKIQEITSDMAADDFLSLNQSDAAKEVTSTAQKSVQNAKKTISSLFSDEKKNDNMWDLQIVPRNSFFDDSFFETVRHNFQKSVDDIMTNRLRRMDSIGDGGSFRKVRESKEEDVQAISVTEDAREHKIVLDVHGFSEGDLKVRAVSESEFIVEGSVEKKTEYTSCTHTFRRSFKLSPSVDIRQATSALSSEGILTIIVPKKLQSIDYSIPVRSEVADQILKTTQEQRENLHREYVVPVTQENLSISNRQTTQETNVSKRTVADSTISDIASSYNVANSQNLLNKLERTIQLCEEIDNRPAPQVPLCLSEKKADKSQIQESHICSEASDLIRESQRLVDESTRLLQDVSASEKATHREHFVPVEVDAGIAVGIKSTDEAQQGTSRTISSTARTTPTSRVIPISFKGSFYNDSVFEDARRSIDKEVKDVFTRYKQSSSVVSSEEGAKEVVEQAKRQESTPVKSAQTVSTILDDAHSYKIVLDVYGFEERELSVKISGANEISIEGHSEKSKAGSVSKHSFQRSFQLPEYVDLERTSTALSEEGILTITVPKKNQLLPINKKSLPFSAQIEKEIREREMKPTLVVDSSGIVQDKRSQLTTAQSNIINTKREYIVPVSIEDASTTTTSAVGNVQSASDLTSQISTSSQTSADVSQGILSSNTSCSSIDSQVERNTTTNVGQSQSLNVETSSSPREETKEIITRPLFNLPIVSRGYFFDDNIFQDSRSMFETILRNKMNRFNRSTSFVDDLGFFKCLRDDVRFTGGNQVATLSDDEQLHKIVLDVHGFTEENLKVRALSDNEIVIEGSAEEKTGNSVSRKSFRKNFVLPKNVDLRGATSVLSSDGVLNIKIPKRKL